MSKFINIYSESFGLCGWIQPASLVPPALLEEGGGRRRRLATLLPDPARTSGPVQPKKLGRKPATPQTIRRSVLKIYVCQLLGQFLPILVKIRPQLWNLKLGHFLGLWFPGPQVFLQGHFGQEFGHLATVSDLCYLAPSPKTNMQTKYSAKNILQNK